MPRYNTLSTSSSGKGVLRITINHGASNLWDWKLTEDLAEVLDAFEGNEEVKVVIFSSGNPDYFIAHYDLRPTGPEAPTAQVQQQKLFCNILFKISKSPIIFIAEIAGVARGIGSEFLLACDMRFADRTKTKIGQPEVTVGIVPGAGGIDYLVRLLGRARALQYLVTGEDVDADTAERLGWINQALEPAQLTSHVDRIATRIASFSSEALAGIKDRINARSRPEDADILKDAQVLAGLLEQYQKQASQRL
ncbi:hypothetical protein NCS55_00475600 [Fusarium keratoplasticum]|nr:hypothetical protein NCS55_00475600 [Fusarium keratoplasticum]